jgi:hypothetical protein
MVKGFEIRTEKMLKYPVQLTQTFRVQRTITIEVEAKSQQEALEYVQEGVDVQTNADLTPQFRDPGWKECWKLENEVATLPCFDPSFAFTTRVSRSDEIASPSRSDGRGEAASSVGTFLSRALEDVDKQQ